MTHMSRPRNRKNALVDSLRIIALISCIALSGNSIAGSYAHQEGNLEHYLKAFDYGKKADQSWIVPSAEYLASLGTVFDAYLASDYKKAHRLSQSIGHEIIEFVDTSRIPIETHYILQEKAKLGSANYKGAGIYVTKSSAKPVAIQAPHPQSDLYTELQAIELYLDSPAGFLFIAGSRRNSSSLSNACSGKYFASDAVHNTNHSYYIAHQRLIESNPQTLVIQLHGFGTTSLKKLQTQCRTNNDKLVNLSEGLKYYSDSNNDYFIDSLAGEINQAGVAKACIYGEDTRSLGGTTNTTGRFSNNSVDACTSNAFQSGHRFIHVEQSFPVRSSYRAEINDQIRDAIERY